MVPLEYMSNFWRTLEMPLINCEVNRILTWSVDCFIIYTDVANQIPAFTITETNIYVPVVTLSTQDNAKLLLQLKLLAQNPNLNHLVDPSFQGVNRLVLVF